MDEHLEADYEDRQGIGPNDYDDITIEGVTPPSRYDEDEEEDEEFYDAEVEERKRDFLEFSRNHPDMAFTGASVADHIYNGGDLESASDDLPREEW